MHRRAGINYLGALFRLIAIYGPHLVGRCDCVALKRLPCISDTRI